MGKTEVFPLPELILLEEYAGNFNVYLEVVYQLFKKDFIDSKPIFRGIRLGLKKFPLSLGKEATFWHLTSEGDDEATRVPDLRRLERIKWPAPLINNSEHRYLKVWENKRGIKSNILIFHEEERYLVILRKGNGYLLPWTAYLIQDNTRVKKLLKEYEQYKMQNPPG
jgi:hypothetical protein